MAASLTEFFECRTCRAICHQRANSQMSSAALVKTEETSSHAAFVIAGFGGVKSGRWILRDFRQRL